MYMYTVRACTIYVFMCTYVYSWYIISRWTMPKKKTSMQGSALRNFHRKKLTKDFSDCLFYPPQRPREKKNSKKRLFLFFSLFPRETNLQLLILFCLCLGSSPPSLPVYVICFHTIFIFRMRQYKQADSVICFHTIFTFRMR